MHPRKTIEGVSLSNDRRLSHPQTLSFLKDVQKQVHANQTCIKVAPPYHMPFTNILGYDNVEDQLCAGFSDSWGRTWIYSGHKAADDGAQLVIFVTWVPLTQKLIQFAKRLLQ